MLVQLLFQALTSSKIRERYQNDTRSRLPMSLPWTMSTSSAAVGNRQQHTARSTQPINPYTRNTFTTPALLSDYGLLFCCCADGQQSWGK